MPKTHKIEITAMSFPASTDVAAGDTVQWTNRMPMAHTVTAIDGSFDSGALGKDQSFSQTFVTAGSVPYRCKIHPFMTGKVVLASAPVDGEPTYTPGMGRRFWFEFDMRRCTIPTS